MANRVARFAIRFSIVVAVLVAATLFTVYLLVHGSLPQLDGQVVVPVSQSVSIERDAAGVPTLTAANRADLAFATGYVHGQDRYFQMDLQRRVAAGELSALLGASFVDRDKALRRHGFRRVAKEVLTQATPEERALLDAYVRGVNAARDAAAVRPFEYLALTTEPEPWLAEDSILVAFAMYIDLNDPNGRYELQRARLHAALPPAVYEFLYPRGGPWDATLDDADLAALRAPIPGIDVIDVRKEQVEDAGSTRAEIDYPGSNNWALSGARTANGGALIANDMHLGLRLAHIWYRARLIVKSDDPAAARDLTGVTLPGLPILIAGSNGRIAWGFTNTHGDFADLVIVETDAQQRDRYRDKDSFVPFKLRREEIAVRGGDSVTVEYRDTQWGPLLAEQLDGKALALAWTAHRAEATNLKQVELEAATSIDAALAIANRAGIPVQNFVVADSAGRIGWTLMGRLPRRNGYDGQLPQCWGCAPGMGFDGWLDPQSYPRVADPSSGQIWTANSRPLGEASAMRLIGDENMDRGARTQQIRDDLSALKQATSQDMLAVHLDDRALFLKRWRDLLLNLLDEAYLRGHPTRRAAQQLVQTWSGRAAVDDAGYRIVRAFRLAVRDDVYRGLIARARKRYPDAQFSPSARFEDSLWQIITTHPEHLLNPGSENWDAQLLASFDRALAELKDECDATDRELRECTWGRRNTLVMEHPLAAALPLAGHWLRMPREQLPGDNDMPRVQGVSFGASERFAVSPGREVEGYFHMPGGQSGHPLSPFFRAGHEAWVKGVATPFLPGPAQHRLDLIAVP